MSTFTAWQAEVHRLGGVPTVWPFASGLYKKFYDRPAARYPAARYASLANARKVSVAVPTQTTALGDDVYVLAPDAVARDAPNYRATPLQQAENTVFTKADQAASAVGLPSLGTWQAWLKNAGWVLLLLLVLAVAVFAKGFVSAA